MKWSPGYLFFFFFWHPIIILYEIENVRRKTFHAKCKLRPAFQAEKTIFVWFKALLHVCLRMRNESHFCHPLKCDSYPLYPFNWRSLSDDVRCLYVLFFSFVNVIRFWYVKGHSFLILRPCGPRVTGPLVWTDRKRISGRRLNYLKSFVDYTIGTRPHIRLFQYRSFFISTSYNMSVIIKACVNFKWRKTNINDAI